MTVVSLGVLGYVVLQLVVGLVVSRRVHTEEEYLVAGRSLGPVLTTASLFATWFGAETCLAAAGEVYQRGLYGATADPLAYGASLVLVGLVFAVPLWRRKLTTLADLFAQRYSGSVERLAALIAIPSSLIWAAAQVRGFGQVLASSSALEVHTAIGLSAAIVVVYTVAGGLLADAVTDVVQGIALAVGLIVTLVVVTLNLGGPASTLAAVRPALLPAAATPPGWLEVVNLWAIPVCGSVLAQELVSRLIASRSARVARGSALVAGPLYLLFGAIPVFLGLLGSRLLPGITAPEQVLMRLAQEHLPIWVYVLFAGALVSAILSTVDSCLLAAAGLLAHNVIVPLKPGLSDAGRLRLARLAVVLFGAISYFLAVHADGIYQLVKDASAFGSAGIFVIGLFGLFSRFGGPPAATASLVVGTLGWFSAAYWLKVPYAYLLSLGGAFAAYLVVGFFERRPANEPLER
ncbi:MAG: sodium:solute symporter family protein [Deltaproteobacteria bacterium]|nr:sodium:solute symporter family protein [Deltaproteobacteria bacterium]